MADVLIERATVITLDPARWVLEDGAVAITGDRIVAVGPTADVRAAHANAATKVIDGYRKIVTPGMVDLHAHSGGAMVKCIGEQLDGVAWRDLLDDIGFRHATHHWWYVDAQLHALERLRFGCTMMLSQPGVSTARMDDPSYARENQRAFEDLGIRARIVVGPARAPWPKTFRHEVNGQWVERVVTFEEVMDVVERFFAEQERSPSSLVDYCTGTSRFGNENDMDMMWVPEQERYARLQAEGLSAIMRRYDVGYWCQTYGNSIEWAYDHDTGLLGSKTILSHCTGISQRAIEILKETDTRVGHHPRARRLYLYPNATCPVLELLEAGVIVGLGSDGPQPDRAGDPFLDLKGAILLQRHRFNDQGVLPPGKALEMATIDAFKALNRDHELGSIEVGKKADLLVVNAFKPHLWPLTMPVHQLVYYATGADVEHVFVDGQQVIEHGRATRIDEAALLEEAEAEMARLMSYPDLRLKELTAIPAQGFWGSTGRA